MKIRYELMIYWSDADQAFIVEVPELSGCVADGETYQAAVQNVEVVIQEWIETAQLLGRSVPEPKGRLLFDAADTLHEIQALTDIKSSQAIVS